MNKEIFYLLILVAVMSCGVFRSDNSSFELSEIEFNLSIQGCIELNSYEVPIILKIRNMGKKEVIIDYSIFVVPCNVKDAKGDEVESEAYYELTYTSKNKIDPKSNYVKILPGENKTLTYVSDFFRFYKFKENEEYFVQGMYPSKRSEPEWVHTNKVKLVFCK